jgi:multiple sugar transport system substrate-binding protein
MWAMGREGEVVQELLPDFERENPGVKVVVQQIPWTAAHEKLLTAYVGRSTPDVAQLGNTWIAEFVALQALETLDSWLAATPDLSAHDFFSGIWETNRMDSVVYGIPWYVDTRVLFYRSDILAAAGHDSVPATWEGWRAAMQDIKQVVGPDRFAIFLPVNEWTQPVILGLQLGSPLLSDNATRGAFSAAEFRRAFDFYLGLFRDGLAPPIDINEIANVYQEFARGYLAMFITGPWNLGEFSRRLPAELQDDWATAPLPGPDAATPGVSLAGGASLVMFQSSKHKELAWRLIEFLSRPEQQVRFFELTGDLPARLESWRDPALTGDPRIRAFEQQLLRVVSTPKIPEWEQIATLVLERAHQIILGAATPDSGLAWLDRDVERILEKRRWLLARGLTAAGEERVP